MISTRSTTAHSGTPTSTSADERARRLADPGRGPRSSRAATGPRGTVVRTSQGRGLGDPLAGAQIERRRPIETPKPPATIHHRPGRGPTAVTAQGLWLPPRHERGGRHPVGARQGRGDFALVPPPRDRRPRYGHRRLRPGLAACMPASQRPALRFSPVFTDPVQTAKYTVPLFPENDVSGSPSSALVPGYVQPRGQEIIEETTATATEDFALSDRSHSLCTAPGYVATTDGHLPRLDDPPSSLPAGLSLSTTPTVGPPQDPGDFITRPRAAT